MKITTKTHETIDIDERQILNFPRGLFGFEVLKDYALLDTECPPFYSLQSVDIESLAFTLIDPFLFRPDYEVQLDSDDLQELGIDEPRQALILSIVTIPNGNSMTANLQGPLIVNRETRLGKQVILQDPRWMVKHDIFAEFNAREANSC
ncbi:MAG: flagellar assembly protein FliW [Treponema sp.]|jgi:flagellar assembly factor FliW|nr:flagellar assembly protein FliW [Treponema sp.]